jgi:hypothetical protein
MNDKFSLMLIVGLWSVATGLVAAQRDPNCVIVLDYNNPSISVATPVCAWSPVNGPLEISVYVNNMSIDVTNANVNFDCLIQGKLAGPLFGLLPSIQGKKNFTGENNRKFPVNLNYHPLGDHGNLLVYVDDSTPTANIRCTAQLTIMDQSLDIK